MGAWPVGFERLSAYLLKVIREARLRSDWYDPDPDVEGPLTAWPAAVLGNPRLVADVLSFVRRIQPYGWSNSLGQKLMQLASPGVPDVYQGTELWDYSLVDPDNRRPVDFAVRRALLSEVAASAEVPAVDESGRAKLLVTARTLRLRRDHPRLFRGYRSLEAQGSAADHLLGFRRGGRRGVVALATRLPATLAAGPGWGDTSVSLPDPGGWTDVLTRARFSGAVQPVRDLLSELPVALLVHEEAAGE